MRTKSKYSGNIFSFYMPVLFLSLLNWLLFTSLGNVCHRKKKLMLLYFLAFLQLSFELFFLCGRLISETVI